MENQLSRYGAISKVLPLMNPGAKVHFVALSSVAWYGDFIAQFKNDAQGGSRVFPTLTAAIADSNVVASRGDVILLLPGFAETLTTALAVSKAGLSIIGIGRGALKPTITVNGAVDGLNITGADVLVENVHFAAPGTDEATAMINVAAGGVTLRNISGIGSTTSKNFVDCITIAATSNDLTIEGLRLYNSVVAVNSFISIEAAVARLTLTDVMCFGDVVAGGLIDAAAATHVFMENVRIAVVGTTKPAATLDSNPTGMARNCFFSGTSTTIADNGALGNALRVDNIKVLEETDNSKSAMILPAVDAE